ncbi:MAG TPA: histone deacetylase [Leptospiraceae bacterium]|nr:histone deacetylase [Leptospirales bacterium]HMU84557.1 histone deacetylase [Leptospiraceae bacterium]HMX58472.1 histone deacetylase [Leptospiraceae bacterium]HMZ37314.1 histone deacetylase [Leptospiraceae bacterium]HNE22284.1 histone deacetylase [Leptospiraceae bacterium]
MAAGIFTDDLFLQHDTGRSHPESPSRLLAIRERLEGGLASHFKTLSRRFADPTQIQLIHDGRYVQELERFCNAHGGYLDGDTPVSDQSYRAALLAAGAGLEAADQIQSGNISRALLLVRPPGHHSLVQRAMGFCLFNNVAICARYLQLLGHKKIAIVDWDVHHGNGTQDAFYEDPSVLFISLHQYPFYPGSGAASETGRGAGAGTTLNCPLPAGSADAEYKQAFEKKILPALEQFGPNAILISAGFDAHRDDPLAGMLLTATSYEWMSRKLRDFADSHCDGRLISFLEGGYNLDALADSVEAHASVLI